MSALLICLSLTYGIGGYRILRSSGQLIFIPILSGVAFGAVIFMMPWAIRMEMDWVRILLFSIPNICFLIFLLVYAVFFKKKGWAGDNLRLLLIRSSALVLLTVFFVTSPIYTWSHRRVFELLNQRNEMLLHNIRMFDYSEEARNYIDQNLCEAAIKAANSARKEGELWLEWNEGDSLKHLKRINGLLDIQFDAYMCKGRVAYKAGNYKEALENYMLVDAILNELIEIDSAKNAFGKVWSWDRMANCYSRLYEYEKSDSLYILAIRQYIEDENKYDENLANMITGINRNIIDQGFINEANKVMEPFISGFEEKNKEEGNLSGTMVLYKHVIRNLIIAGEQRKAKQYIQKGLAVTAKDSLDYFELQHYNGFSALMEGEYIEAINSFKKANAGYRVLLEPNHENFVGIKQALFKAYVFNGEYKIAKEHLSEALLLAEKVYSKSSVGYYKVLQDVGLMNYTMAEYVQAQSKLQKVNDYYEQKQGLDDKQAEVLSLLAVLEVEKDNMAEAKEYAAKAAGLAKDKLLNELPVMDGIWLNLARVELEIENYESATTIYNRIANRNGEFNQVQKAEALTGLAVIAIEKGNHEEAAKNLEEALFLANRKLKERHPTIAAIYHNKSRLLLEQGDIKGALSEANKAEAVIKELYSDNHPSYGDVSVLNGDIMIAAKQIRKGAIYYNKAEESYSKKYKKDHRKRQYVREVLKLIEAKDTPLQNF